MYERANAATVAFFHHLFNLIFMPLRVCYYYLLKVLTALAVVFNKFWFFFSFSNAEHTFAVKTDCLNAVIKAFVWFFLSVFVVATISWIHSEWCARHEFKWKKIINAKGSKGVGIIGPFCCWIEKIHLKKYYSSQVHMKAFFDIDTLP